jgi:MFS family permease
MRLHVLFCDMTSASPSPHIAGDRWDARAWALLVVLCGVVLLDGLDISMVGVALPSIGRDLQISTSSLQWVVSGYVLGYGGLLLLGGRAADLLGRRRVLLAGLVAFAGASLVGGLVDDATLLIASRFLKGAAAAFTAPAALSIITTTFAEGHARNKALGIFTACGASGYSLGLVLGGVLTEVGWRWAFIVPVPIALGLLFAARRFVPSVVTARTPAGYDIAGALTVTASMLLLVATIVEAPKAGWASPRTLLSFIGVALLLSAFVTIENRVKQPLVRLGIFRSSSLVRANLAAMAVVGSYFGFQFILTIYLQTVLGWSPLDTALALLPAGVFVAFGAPRMAPLIERFGTAAAIAASLSAFLLGYVLFLGVGGAPSYWFAILPTVLLAGVGFAIGFPALNIQATAGVADSEQGLASGLVNTSFQVGGAVVTAVVSAAITSGEGSVPQLSALDNGVLVIIAAASLGLVTALAGSFAWWRARLAPATR